MCTPPLASSQRRITTAGVGWVRRQLTHLQGTRATSRHRPLECVVAHDTVRSQAETGALSSVVDLVASEPRGSLFFSGAHLSLVLAAAQRGFRGEFYFFYRVREVGPRPLSVTAARRCDASIGAELRQWMRLVCRLGRLGAPSTEQLRQLPAADLRARGSRLIRLLGFVVQEKLSRLFCLPFGLARSGTKETATEAETGRWGRGDAARGDRFAEDVADGMPSSSPPPPPPRALVRSRDAPLPPARSSEEPSGGFLVIFHFF